MHMPKGPISYFYLVVYFPVRKRLCFTALFRFEITVFLYLVVVVMVGSEVIKDL